MVSVPSIGQIRSSIKTLCPPPSREFTAKDGLQELNQWTTEYR